MLRVTKCRVLCIRNALGQTHCVTSRPASRVLRNSLHLHQTYAQKYFQCLISADLAKGKELWVLEDCCVITGLPGALGEHRQLA
jgi:hypothetical protein